MNGSEHNATPTAAIARPIATAGEVFTDGVTIELVSGVNPGHLQLMLWDGLNEISGTAVEYHGQLYEAPKIEGSLLRQLTLPTRCCPHGSTREFLTETCDIMKNLVGLDEKSASLAARIVLCSAIVDALSIAPALVIAGPDTARANRLMTLLRCLCWRSVFLTSVTPASFCSLANGVRFTFLISQTNVSDKLRKLLDDSSNRDRKIPYRGRLLDLFGVQVIHSDSLFIADSWPLRSIQISVTPTNTALPDFGQDAQQRIATQFQQKLLSFRRANLGAARRLNFDESNFSPTLRDLARSLAAATPDDAELQAEVIELLREEDSESRSARWTDLHVIAVEAVLTAYKESPGEAVYVGELANIAETLLNGRGKNSEVDPGPFGKLLKMLHFVTEPRDAKGVKLLLTEAVRTHALQLARHLEIPGCGAPSLARPETTPQECCEKSNSILAM